MTGTPVANVLVSSTTQHCPIYLCSDLTDAAQLMQPLLRQQVTIVTDSHVASLYLAPLTQALQAFSPAIHILPPGEAAKSLASVAAISDTLLTHGMRRQATLLALGGGVVGDVAGFTAACYQRGIDYIQLPTTLIAQADAAIGGKTAVNHPLAKNMLGAFHQPRAVVSAVNTLETLTSRDFIAGLGEVIKYALLADAELFVWLEQNLAALLQRETLVLTHAVRICSQIKARIVNEDATEQGVRALLNLGHTFAHAIEVLTDYRVLHGEAVAIGLVLAARLSAQLLELPASVVLRIIRLIETAGLPTELPPECESQAMLSLMQRDKKNVDQHLRLILLNQIGAAQILPQVSAQQVLSILEKNG